MRGRALPARPFWAATNSNSRPVGTSSDEPAKSRRLSAVQNTEPIGSTPGLASLKPQSATRRATPCRHYSLLVDRCRLRYSQQAEDIAHRLSLAPKGILLIVHSTVEFSREMERVVQVVFR